MPVNKDKFKYKSIGFEKDLYAKLEQLANENDRSVDGQIKYMLKQYIKLTEK